MFAVRRIRKPRSHGRDLFRLQQAVFVLHHTVYGALPPIGIVRGLAEPLAPMTVETLRAYPRFHIHGRRRAPKRASTP